MHLSELLHGTLTGSANAKLGRVQDVVVRLRGNDYPVVVGLVARVGSSDVFVPMDQVEAVEQDAIRLSTTTMDLRPFERRDGEVLLRADVLGHRLIDVGAVELVRAYDVELDVEDGPWVVQALDTRRPARFFGLLPQGRGHPSRDWKVFEPLIGHAYSARSRGPFGRVRRLRPAQIADLLEEASRGESDEILQAVHGDPELEADVFEELDPDRLSELLRERSDPDVAALLARMRADDAADALMDLPQDRRIPVLDLLPPGQGTKVRTLLGFNPGTAGGLMGLDFLTMPSERQAGEALVRIRSARSMQPEALTTVFLTGEDDRLTGSVTLVRLAQASPLARLADVGEADPVHIHLDADLTTIALEMTDFNLVVLPVTDDNHHVIGLITVDDVLEETIPEDWRRRELTAHVDAEATDEASSEEATTP